MPLKPVLIYRSAEGWSLSDWLHYIKTMFMYPGNNWA